ncbi:hypothetical protein BDV93DRAFT_540114 [Ceratobasidium sp. AG-I]|nr:hypothetical protein BDV93DRAFT_540114 [Ceratobasidium sp. AG-I]
MSRYACLAEPSPTASELPHPASPIETLPNELLYRIATFIPANSVTATSYPPKPDRFHLALICKRINAACTPLLYEYVFLDSPFQLVRFHNSAGVKRESWRTVSIIFGYRALFTVESGKHLRGTRWEHVLSPLRKMRSLRELVIDSNEETGNYAQVGIEHPVLKYLARYATEPHFLPRLSILEVPFYPELLSLCRGRPMTSVMLGSNPSPMTSEAFDTYIPELGRIQGALEELGLFIPLEVDSRIRQVVGLCPNVKVANLRLGRNLWASHNFEDAFSPWAEQTLSPWSNLTHLTLRTYVHRSVPLSDQFTTIRSLNRILPKLTYVILPMVRGEWTRAPGPVSNSGHKVPEWTPRPDLGVESLDWWLDMLYLQVQAKPPHGDDAEYTRTLDATAVLARAGIRSRWGEPFVPALRDIKTRLAELARPSQT